MNYPHVTSIEISGDKGIIIPSNGTKSSTYTAYAKDQYGNVMQDVNFTWSIDAYETDGVTIDGSTITISNNVAEQTVIIKAINANVTGEYKVVISKQTYTYIPIDGGFQITNGTADYVRPIYAPHMNDAPGNARYIYYLGDRPKLVLSDANNGSTADNGSTGNHLVRFAHMFLGIKNGENSKWLDEMEQITSRYVYGREEYDITDPSFEGVIKLVFTRSDKLDAMLIKVTLTDALVDKLVVAAAGQRGADGGQPVGGNSSRLEFQVEDTEGSTIYTDCNKFMIADNKVAVSGTASVPLCYAVKDASAYPAGINALLSSQGGNHPMVVGSTEGNKEKEVYLLLTTEETTNRYFRKYQTNAREIFEDSVAYYKELSETIKVKTPNPYLNSAITAQMMALDGSWNDPLICHGPIGWHIAFAGWRAMYGFVTAGWYERVKANVRQFIKNQQSTGRITAYYASDSRYNMGEVLVDQLMYYWLWTGDNEFFEKEAYEFVARHLQYQDDYIRVAGSNLYENFLNAWNTDNKWNNGGPGSIATAYTWRAYQVMSQIAEVLGKTKDAQVYKEKADAIKVEMKAELWDNDTGVYGEFKDIFGLKRLNTAPDLSSIYTPIDVGIADDMEGYQMLRYSDYAIASIEMDGCVFKYSSNRAPLFYSSCGLYAQETMNNALAYFQIGQWDMGYKQFMGCLIPLFKGRAAGPGVSAHTTSAELTNTGHIDFADTTSLYVRTAVEGIFGIMMKRPYGMVEIKPGFPKDWKKASIETDYLSYSFQYANHMDTFVITSPSSIQYEMKVPARSSMVESVKVNGQEVDFTVTKFVCFITDKLTHATVEIKYGVDEIASVCSSGVGAIGSEYTVKSNGMITEIIDPQGIIADKFKLPATNVDITLGEKSGHHTFFVKVVKNDMITILPVDLEVKAPLEIIDATVVTGEKAGVNIKLRNNTQSPMKVIADVSTISGSVKVEKRIDKLGYSDIIFVPVENIFDLTPGNNKIIAKVSGDFNGMIESEAIDWTLNTVSDKYKTISLDKFVNQDLRTLHENSYDITYNGDEHYVLPKFYFAADTTRTVTTTGRSWWEDSSRGKNGVPDSLNLPSGSSVYITDIGVPFHISSVGANGANAAFVSLYNQFPDRMNIPINETGSKIYFMLSVSTNNMQSRIENARITINLSDGTKEVLPLINPDNIDDWLNYQQSRDSDWDSYEEAKPYAETGYIQKLSTKAHSNILAVDLGEVKDIASIDFECLSNEVLAGLLGVTVV